MQRRAHTHTRATASKLLSYPPEIFFTWFLRRFCEFARGGCARDHDRATAPGYVEALNYARKPRENGRPNLARFSRARPITPHKLRLSLLFALLRVLPGVFY